MRKVFEQDIVAKNEGREENELSSDATIRFELDDVKYEVSVNDVGELRIYKMAIKLPQTDTIRIKPKSSNVVVID